MSPATIPLIIWKRARTALGPSLGASHYLFAFVFFIRLWALVRLSASSLLLPIGGDMRFYDEWAQRILHGVFTDHLAFYGLPLYAYLLAAIYKLVGQGSFVPGLLQACLEAGTAVLIYKIASRVFVSHADKSETGSDNRGQLIFGKAEGKTIGVIAAIAWAFFVPAQAYSIILMPTSWMIFVFWLVVWGMVKADLAPRPLVSFFYGTLLGAAAMGVATILFLVPMLLVAILFKPKDTAQRYRSLAIATLFIGLALGSSPCWLHNRFIAHDSVLLSAHGGINLWIGNNPEATGYPHFPGLHASQAALFKDSIDLAETAAQRPLQRSEVSEFWAARARSYIRNNFPAWLKLLGRKATNFWNAFEYDDLNVISVLREGGIVFPGLHFGIVAALAIPGICFSLKEFPGTRWILSAILLQLVAVLPVFVTERYRLVIVPGLLLFALFALVHLWRSLCQGNYLRSVFYVGLVFAAGTIVSSARKDPSLWALTAYESGRQALESGDLALARKKLELANAYVPNNADTHFAFGNLSLQEKKFAKAKEHYFATLQLEPRHKGALNNLGLLALDEQRWEIAVQQFRAALALNPLDAKTHYLLAQAERGAGNQASAMAEIEIALRLRPAQKEFLDFRDIISGNR